jgi:hypothetical protein
MDSFLFLSHSSSLSLFFSISHAPVEAVAKACRVLEEKKIEEVSFPFSSFFEVSIKTSTSNPVSKTTTTNSPLNTPSIGGSCAANAAQGGDPLPLARTRPSMRSPTEKIWFLNGGRRRRRRGGG